ncbi:type II toxin-antitoxin system VapC family toxin [Sorangium sp. So ce1097]|uniref:type II toxin-antitoxin system VapC family toxin n=1 Tax=Sorangium sp. So ce1097 TaxID=3133330 RepID=UPI003F6063B3
MGRCVLRARATPGVCAVLRALHLRSRERVYLDSRVLIYRVEGAEPCRGSSDRALMSLVSGMGNISPLVRMECLVKPIRLNDSGLRATYEGLLSVFELLPLSADVFDLATELRAMHGLKTPDALHAACAIHHGCDQIWTNDDRLRHVSGRIAVRIIG